MAGRRASSRKSAGHSDRFTYDAYGRVTRVTDPASNVSKVQYDLLNRPTKTTDPRSFETTFNYSANKVDLFRVTDAKGQVYLPSVGRPTGYEVWQTNAKGSDYIQYTLKGTLNRQSGVYEIGVRRSSSGRNEVITHWFFRPDSYR